MPSWPSRLASLALLLSSLALTVGCGSTELTTSAIEAPIDSSQEQALGASAKLGVNIDVDNPTGNPNAAQLTAAGARMVRFTFKDDSWGAGPDPAALARYREKIDQLNAAGVQTLLLFSYESVPGFPVQSTDRGAWDAYRARYIARLTKVAAAYGDSVAAYEVWNEMDEPNNRPEYAPWVPPKRYGELLRDAYLTIKAHSSAVVVSGGADSGDATYLQVARDSVGWLYADAVGLHPYGQRPDPWWPDSSWGFGDLADVVTRYQEATSRPIWITEVGINDPSLQAEFLERTLKRLNGSVASKVERILWFCWSDGMVDGFGLVDAGGAPRDSYWRFKGAAAPVAQPSGPADGVASSGTPPLATPIIHRACFTRFWVPGDDAPSIRADVEVEVPAWAWTQPMGTSAASCDWYWPGESFRLRFPEIGGAWRIGIDVNGAARARDDFGVDHPWRFALLADGCGLSTNEGVPATPGRYTIAGFFKLAPGDETDPAKFYAGMVQENQRWSQDGKGCQSLP